MKLISLIKKSGKIVSLIKNFEEGKGRGKILNEIIVSGWSLI
jgi:hypothetical protein